MDTINAGKQTHKERRIQGLPQCVDPQDRIHTSNNDNDRKRTQGNASNSGQGVPSKSRPQQAFPIRIPERYLRIRRNITQNFI